MKSPLWTPADLQATLRVRLGGPFVEFGGRSGSLNAQVQASTSAPVDYSYVEKALLTLNVAAYDVYFHDDDDGSQPSAITGIRITYYANAFDLDMTLGGHNTCSTYDIHDWAGPAIAYTHGMKRFAPGSPAGDGWLVEVSLDNGEDHDFPGASIEDILRQALPGYGESLEAERTRLAIENAKANGWDVKTVGFGPAAGLDVFEGMSPEKASDVLNGIIGSLNKARDE